MARGHAETASEHCLAGALLFYEVLKADYLGSLRKHELPTQTSTSIMGVPPGFLNKCELSEQHWSPVLRVESTLAATLNLAVVALQDAMNAPDKLCLNLIAVGQ